jgi:thiol-disulfide isomerase/thioredoxin
MTTPGQKRPAQRPTSQPAARRIPVAGIALGVVAAAIVAAIVFTGGGDDDTAFGSVVVSGAALPGFTGSGAIADDPAVGAAMPSVDGADFDGTEVAIGPDGVAKGVLFLAHWCSHCQAEVPRVVEWLATTGGVPGVEIAAVSTAMDPVQVNYPPDEWLEREGWPTPVLVDDEDGTAFAAFGGTSFPYWVFVDAEGRVVARTAGELDITTLEAFLTLAGGG